MENWDNDIDSILQNPAQLEEMLRRMVADFKNAMQEMVSSYKEVGDFVNQQRNAFELRDTVTAQADMISKTIADSISKAMSQALIDPATYNVGAIGHGLGSALGAAIGFATGSLTGTPFGTLAGTEIGSKIGGFVGSGIQNIIEGPTITGARTAQIQYATHKIDSDFTKSGWSYLLQNEKLARQLGMTKAEVSKAADDLSKMGYGFFEQGSQGAIRFSQTMDKVLNLPVGTTLGMVSRSVKEYGENINEVRKTYNQLIDTGGNLYRIYELTGNTITRSLSAYANLADALAQVDAQASNTNASMEGINVTFLKLIELAGDPRLGGPLGRPAPIFQGAQQLALGLGPAGDYRGGTDVAQAGAIMRAVLQETESGRRILSEATERAKKSGWASDDVAMRTGAYLIPELWEMQASDKNVTQRLSHAALSGLEPYSEAHAKSGMLAFTFYNQMMGLPGGMMAYQIMRRAIASGKFTGSLAEEAEFLKHPEQHIPQEYRQFLRQARASQSVQERIEKHLAQLTHIFGQNWWENAKRVTSEVFGLTHTTRGFEHRDVATGAAVPTRGDVIESNIMAGAKSAFDTLYNRWTTGKSLLVEEHTTVTDGKAIQEQNKELKRHVGNAEIR